MAEISRPAGKSTGGLTARQLAHLGDRIRDLRLRDAQGRVSQRELAKRTGLSPTTIGELEQGRHEPRLGTMLALRDGLGLGSIEELLGTMPSAALGDLSQQDRATLVIDDSA